MFSSMPARNTASNSKPLAACSVISVTAPRCSSMPSRSVISATFSKKSVMPPSGLRRSKSVTAPRSSSMFSSRAVFSSLGAASYWRA